MNFSKNLNFFCFTPLKSYENELKVKRHFSKPFVYYFGSDTQCGCNFRGGECWAEYEFAITTCTQDELETYQKNHEKLNEYLKKFCSDVDLIEIYGCWSGDETCEPERIVDITLDCLTGGRFCFEERTFYKIKMKSPGD